MPRMLNAGNALAIDNAHGTIETGENTTVPSADEQESVSSDHEEHDHVAMTFQSTRKQPAKQSSSGKISDDYSPIEIECSHDAG